MLLTNLRGKREDILFHGTDRRCIFEGVLEELLMEPVTSKEDRDVLRMIAQTTSHLIFGLSGIEIQFSDGPFEIV